MRASQGQGFPRIAHTISSPGEQGFVISTCYYLSLPGLCFEVVFSVSSHSECHLFHVPQEIYLKYPAVSFQSEMSFDNILIGAYWDIFQLEKICF